MARVRRLAPHFPTRPLSSSNQFCTTTSSVLWPPVAARTITNRVLDVLDERKSSLRLVAYVPAPDTGTREKMEKLLAVQEPLLAASLESV